MSLLSDARVANQRPTLSSYPPYFSSLGEDAVALSAHAGLVLDDWQAFVLEQSLGQKRGGRWSAMEVGLIVPRQNGKGSIIEARQLAGLFLTRDQQQTYSAHKFKTAKAMYRRLRKLCKETPDLDREVLAYRQSNDEMGIETRAGGRLDYFARFGGNSRGFSGDTNYFDEAYDLDQDMLGDFLPTLSAMPNPQVWYVSSAGKRASLALKKVRERGMSGDPGLCFSEWSAERDADLNDVDTLIRVNPGIPTRLDLDYILSVERQNLDDEQYARERFGIWHDPTTPEVIKLDAWRSRESSSSEIVGDIVVAVSTGIDGNRTAIAVAGENADGEPHVELVEYEAGISWSAERTLEISKRWDALGVAVDPTMPTKSIIPALQDGGIEPYLMSSRDVQIACALLLERVDEGPLWHPPAGRGQVEVVQAIEVATKRMIGDRGGWGWGRRTPDIDIAPLEAVTNALYMWLSRTARAVKRPKTGVIW